MGLTPKQVRFVEEYVVDLNATRAAERAGYKQPHVQGPRLLENVEVQEAVDAAKAQRSERTQIDAAWVLERLKTVAERCLSEELNAAGANKALELLAKHTAALERPIRVDLPEIQDANDSVQALSTVLAAVGSGQITPSEGQAVANLVESFRRTLETQEIERRLAALEDAQKAEK